MTIKGKVKKEVEHEVVFSVPSYAKAGDQYFALIEEKKFITIHLWETTGTLISQGTPTSYDFACLTKAEQITEDDFQFALGMAMERLSKFQTATV